MSELWPWLVVCGLGAYHGINPGMGWLFAVALGLQEKRPSAIARALPAIGLGHALSIVAVLALLVVAQTQLPIWLCRWAAGLILIGFGGYRLFRFRHPTWSRMRVGFWSLTLWSFIMASAHGAGLMLFPVFLAPDHAPESTLTQSMSQTVEHGSEEHSHSEHLRFSGPLLWMGAVAIHTGAHLLTAGLIAWIVYAKLGVSILRQLWYNLDLVWAVALIVAGLWTLLWQ